MLCPYGGDLGGAGSPVRNKVLCIHSAEQVQYTNFEKQIVTSGWNREFLLRKSKEPARRRRYERQQRRLRLGAVGDGEIEDGDFAVGRTFESGGVFA
jgi:hypothetical protein